MTKKERLAVILTVAVVFISSFFFGRYTFRKEFISVYKQSIEECGITDEPAEESDGLCINTSGVSRIWEKLGVW